MGGHIVQRKGKQNWSIVLEFGYDPQTGKRRQKWLAFRGKRKDAQKHLTELLYKSDRGLFVPPSKLTTGEFLSGWLKDCEPRLSPRGFERYRDIVKELISSLGNIPLTQLRPEHLQNYYAGKLKDGISAGGVRYHHAVLHVALATAVKGELLSRNVADGVSPPRVRSKEMQIWSEDDIKTFLEAARKTPYYELFYLALWTGMRRSELLGLRWCDVDLLLCQIFINRSLHHLKNGSYVFTEPKSVKSRRTIALSPSVALVLRTYREKQEAMRLMLGTPLKESDLIFSHVDGSALRPNTITRAWEILAAKVGLKVIRFHDARHTHASLMLKQGIHPKIVQERLGHSSIQITLDRYSHVAPGLQQAAALKFDEGLLSRQESEAAKEAVKSGG